MLIVVLGMRGYKSVVEITLDSGAMDDWDVFLTHGFLEKGHDFYNDFFFLG